MAAPDCWIAPISAVRSTLVAFLAGDEILENRLAHQVGREQALREDEIVKFLLVELLAERRFRFLAQFEQLREAVEI
jgi:hypothetical protein